MLGPFECTLLIVGGAIAGFINTLAGGGSFLTVPLLIFVGLPPTVANGTNRVAVLAQTLAAVAGFRQENVPGLRFAARLLPAVLVGSWLGAVLASSLSEELFSRAFGVVMLLALPVILWSPKPGGETDADRRGLPIVAQLALYFALGVYGGAVQAGIGIPLLLALVGAGGLDLVRANSVKVAVVAALTLVAVAQFIYAGKVVWLHGLVLALGSGVGGYVASRFGARVGDRLIRPVLGVAIVGAALRLLWWN
jgi:hypothetical protein